MTRLHPQAPVVLNAKCETESPLSLAAVECVTPEIEAMVGGAVNQN